MIIPDHSCIGGLVHSLSVIVESDVCCGVGLAQRSGKLEAVI